MKPIYKRKRQSTTNANKLPQWAVGIWPHWPAPGRLQQYFLELPSLNLRLWPNQSRSPGMVKHGGFLNGGYLQIDHFSTETHGFGMFRGTPILRKPHIKSSWTNRFVVSTKDLQIPQSYMLKRVIVFSWVVSWVVSWVAREDAMSTFDGLCGSSGFFMFFNTEYYLTHSKHIVGQHFTVFNHTTICLNLPKRKSIRSPNDCDAYHPPWCSAAGRSAQHCSDQWGSHVLPGWLPQDQQDPVQHPPERCLKDAAIQKLFKSNCKKCATWDWMQTQQVIELQIILLKLWKKIWKTIGTWESGSTTRLNHVHLLEVPIRYQPLTEDLCTRPNAPSMAWQSRRLVGRTELHLHRDLPFNVFVLTRKGESVPSLMWFMCRVRVFWVFWL